MHRTLRMLGILIDLQNGATTVGALAEKYECSRKTIQRDLSELVELNIPIDRAAGANGGITLDSSWNLAPMNMTPEELETVILALEHASHLPASGPTLAKIRSATKPAYFDAVDHKPDRPVSRPGVPTNMPEIVADVRKVMQRDLWCKIDYSGGSNPGWRLILPQELQIAEGRWYVQSIDERSHERRSFRIDRIRQVVPALAPPNAAEIVAAATSQTEYSSPSYPEVVVELTERGVAFCRDHHHLHRGLNGQQLRFRCPPSEYRYMARELMRMGTDCRIVAPDALKMAAREFIEELSRHLEFNADTTVS